MTIHKTLDFILTKNFDQLLRSDALVRAPVEEIGTQFPHLQVILIKNTSSGKIENVASKNNRLVTSLPQSDTKFLFKAWDANSVLQDKLKRTRTFVESNKNKKSE